MTFSPNQFRHATTLTSPGEFREGRWTTFEPPEPVARTLQGRPVRLRPGLTFTPYANPTPCNAHCTFCSEELQRKDALRLSAKTPIADRPRYFQGLRRVWQELEGFPMGLSLSGLEATSDPEWLLELLTLVQSFSGLFPQRVLYSNGSGLFTDERLLPALRAADFTRLELSRCHPDTAINQRLMRFNGQEPVLNTHAFEEAVTRAQVLGLPVKLVCILNTRGTRNLADVETYLGWAASLGVSSVVFRGLSELGTAYKNNRTLRWIEDHRVNVRELMDEVLPVQPDGQRKPRADWQLNGVTSGYYYYNEVYRFRGLEVTFEGSSYVAHQEQVDAGVIQKLVFHSTGELAGDWVPNSQPLGQY